MGGDGEREGRDGVLLRARAERGGVTREEKNLSSQLGCFQNTLFKALS